jgi:hypothetical protein
MSSDTSSFMTRYIHNLLDRTLVGQLGKRTIEWLCQHEDDFRIARAANSAVPWQVKPLAELMFLLTALKRHGLSSSSLDRLSLGALAEAGKFDWHELAAYDPSAATGMALVADFFHSQQQPAPFDERFFGFLNGIGYFEGMDRLPYRDMDLAYNLGRLVSSDYEKEIPIWFRSTAFGRRQHIVRYTIDDVYSLTHAIFYLTDLGLRAPDVLLDPETADRLRTELATLTGAMLRADNPDVLGELLLCWLFCDIERTPLNSAIFDQGLRQMMAAVTDGAVAPTAKIFRRARTGQATFKQLYHTTLVGAFLFNLLSKRKSYAIN